jgi:ribosomal protein L24E
MKVEVVCLFCGKKILRYPSKVGKRNFCSRDCKNKHVSKKHNPEGYRRNYNAHHLTELNRKLNPTRMTPEVRKKLREARLGKGEGKTYTKIYGVHAHRVIAEQKLGRKLKPGEVVHHIDGNIRNNDPNNLMVFASQKEHAAFHAKERKFFLS